MKGLAIKDVAARTGIAAGTIRMWEQRYGFPEPERTSAGYRVYSEEDVEALRRVVAYRERGLSVPAAVDRARLSDLATDRPSLYGVLVAGASPPASQVLSKRTLIQVSRAIEDETISRAASPVVIAAFQSERNYRAVEHRYRAMARTADAVLAFADFPRLGGGGDAPVEVPLGATDGLGNEWAVVVDAPGYCACLLAWEQPRARGRAGPRAPLRGDVDARPARRAPCGRGGRDARAARRRRPGRADGRAAGRAAAGDGAAGALPDRSDEPDRRLLGRR